MAFDWQEYMTLAGRLANGEAEQRSAVSRAYYAAFHTIKRYLIETTSIQLTQEGKDHQLVIKGLRTEGYSTQSQLLLVLRDRRNECDYDDSIADLKGMYTQAINDARTLITRFK